VSIDANAATLSGLPVPPASDQANPVIWLAVRSFDRCRLRGEPSATGGNIDETGRWPGSKLCPLFATQPGFSRSGQIG
jgi:hypothetical protein